MDSINTIKGKRRARKLVLQALYQWLLSGMELTEIEAQFRVANDMQKVDAEVKVNSLKFTSESPAFSMDRYKKFMETQAKEDNPWLPRKINFKVDGIALTRQAVPKLIQVLKDTGIFDIPKPPSTKFVAEVTKQGRDAKGNETIETEAAHYEFSLEGVLVLGNAI